MNTYTLTTCTNNETLRGSRSIDQGCLDDACVEACDAAADIFHDVIGALPVSDDCFDLETSSNFSDWNGGRMDGDQYFRLPGAQKHGFVVIKCDDVHAEIPPELVELAEAMHAKMTDHLDKCEMESQYNTFGSKLVDWVEEARIEGLDPVLVTILLLDKGIDLSCYVMGSTKTEESLSRLFAEISARYPKPENN